MMPTLRTIRQLTCCLFAATLIVLATTVVRANSMNQFCTFWSTYQGISCINESWDWTWYGSWDLGFMDEEDALNLADDLCFDLYNSCNDACETYAYKEYLAWLHSTPFCEYDPECFETWGNPSCSDIAVEGDYSCTCDNHNFCEEC